MAQLKIVINFKAPKKIIEKDHTEQPVEKKEQVIGVKIIEKKIVEEQIKEKIVIPKNKDKNQFSRLNSLKNNNKTQI